MENNELSSTGWRRLLFVRLAVVNEVAGVVEGFGALLARIGFAAGVPVEVCLEPVAPAKALAADLADETPLVGLVRALVTVAVAQAGEGFTADGTLERLLFGVRPLVLGQVAALHEAGTAHVALEHQALMHLNRSHGCTVKQNQHVLEESTGDGETEAYIDQPKAKLGAPKSCKRSPLEKCSLVVLLRFTWFHLVSIDYFAFYWITWGFVGYHWF